jgi:beta-lysine 5,6-aminomutase beta subunit
MMDNTAVKPYGDTLNDGRIQMSFSLPMESSPEAQEAAKRLAGKMGLEEVSVVSMHDMGEAFSFFVLYGRCKYSVDTSNITVAKVETKVMTYYEINAFVKDNIGRKLNIVGACTGFDAHTVGLDAIMNMKGYAGEYGLERYPEINAWNLGSQVPNETLIKKAALVNADAILVSQVVTQKEIHIKNLTNLVELLEAENIRDKFILVAGGPRISHELALEIGFDAGFGPGSLPPDVASYVAQMVQKRASTRAGRQ